MKGMNDTPNKGLIESLANRRYYFCPFSFLWDVALISLVAAFCYFTNGKDTAASYMWSGFIFGTCYLPVINSVPSE